ncbi:hypothetical protein F5Y15DRAFT_33082 [Xylariaceae sp. FL0016]|nr:hypothetical protein F5Y15DRAFT_33082 [Xylariaceae sp. FL0016]
MKCQSPRSTGVTFPVFCKIIRSRCGYHQWTVDAVAAGLPLAIRRIQLCHGDEATLPLIKLSKATASSIIRPSPFPNAASIDQILAAIFGGSISLAASQVDLEELSEVKAFMRERSALDQGHQIWPRTFRNWKNDDVFDGPPLDECNSMRTLCNPDFFSNEEGETTIILKHESLSLIQKIAEIAIMVLALSLFENVKDLVFDPAVQVDEKTSIASVCSILCRGYRDTSISKEIFKEALLYISPSSERRGSHQLACLTAKGQTVWRSLYSELSIREHGYYAISSCRGQLQHQRDVFREVVPYKDDSNYNAGNRHPMSHFTYEPIRLTPTLNLFSGTIMTEWWVEAEDSRLTLALVIRNKDQSLHLKTDPTEMERGLRHTWLVRCRHSPKTPVKQQLPSCDFIAPYMTQDPVDYVSKPVKSVRIIAAAKDEALQLYLIAMQYENVVLRRGACLGCCFDACKITESKILIL